MEFDTSPTRIEHTEKAVVYKCTTCDNFELTKQYSGVKDASGKAEYDSNTLEECPVCGEDLEKIPKS